MENAVEAIQMAFAVMVFVLALSVSMFSFNSAKSASDVMLYVQDETNYYDYQEAAETAESRIVGLETIIPTLYKYYKENYTVVFRQGNYDETTGNLTNLEALPVYKTPSTYRSGANGTGTYMWGTQVGTNNYSTYDMLMYKKYNKCTIANNGTVINAAPGIFKDVYDAIGTGKGNSAIFSFDVEEETSRHEPWTGDYNKTKDFINNFLDGVEYTNPNDDTKKYQYLNKTGHQTAEGFVEKYANKKFVETVGEYTYKSNQADDTQDEDGSSISSLVKEKKKRVIIFTLINN